MNPSVLADQMLARSGTVGDPSIRPHYPGGMGDPYVRPNYPGMGAPIQQMDAPGAGQRPVQYSEQQYVAGDVTWFGFGHTTIVAGALGQKVSLKPLRPLAPQKLFCPSNTQNLSITQAGIAGTNLFAGDLGTPIELFSEVSTSPQIVWPSLETSTGIDFLIANDITAGDKQFRGAFYCTALRR